MTRQGDLLAYIEARAAPPTGLHLDRDEHAAPLRCGPWRCTGQTHRPHHTRTVEPIEANVQMIAYVCGMPADAKHDDNGWTCWVNLPGLPQQQRTGLPDAQAARAAADQIIIDHLTRHP